MAQQVKRVKIVAGDKKEDMTNKPKFFLSALPKVDGDKLVHDTVESISNSVSDIGSQLITSVQALIAPDDLNRVRESFGKTVTQIEKKTAGMAKDISNIVTTSFNKIKI